MYLPLSSLKRISLIDLSAPLVRPHPPSFILPISASPSRLFVFGIDFFVTSNLSFHSFFLVALLIFTNNYYHFFIHYFTALYLPSNCSFSSSSFLSPLLSITLLRLPLIFFILFTLSFLRIAYLLFFLLLFLFLFRFLAFPVFSSYSFVFLPLRITSPLRSPPYSCSSLPPSCFSSHSFTSCSLPFLSLHILSRLDYVFFRTISLLFFIAYLHYIILCVVRLLVSQIESFGAT